MNSNGALIFQGHTLQETIALVESERSNWPYAEYSARVAICAAANNISVWEAMELLDLWDGTETSEDSEQTAQDVATVAGAVMRRYNW